MRAWLVTIACLAIPSGMAAADVDEDWTRIARDRLFDVQVLLATGRADEARSRAGELLAHREGLVAPERMWLHIYKGCAFDRAGNRKSAAAAFRAALAIHDHPVAEQGARQRVPTLRHLETLKDELDDAKVRRGEVQSAGQPSVHWVAIVPEKKPRLVLIRVGHPQDQQGLSWALASLRKVSGVPADAVLVTTDVLPVVMHGRKLVVDDPELIEKVPRLFKAAVDDVKRALHPKARSLGRP